MAWLTQLEAVAKRTGYPVTAVSGWKTRGHGPQPEVQGIVCHHTAGATAGGDYPALAVVRDGRTGLPGPLSHFGIGRSGRIYVIAAGRCWHNAPSTSSYHTNSASIGIEAENDGRQAWPAAQLDAYRKLCVELCKEFDLPASRVKGHKEVNTQKPDPHSISMTEFRADVARLIKDPAGAEATGGDPLIGLKKGDEGQAVYALQALIEFAGFGDALGGVDGRYGPATAEALRLVRKSMGSSAKPGYGDSVSGWAYAQLMAAVARKQD
jgi:hypothetical protein